jgi:tetratricopeptide (TPR) repeat protein
VSFDYCRDYDAALVRLRKALLLDPEHFWTHSRIALVLERQGSFEAARVEFEKANQRLRAVQTFAALGRTSDVRNFIQEALTDPDPESQAFHLGAAYAGIGNHAEAMKWLTVAVRRQVYDVIYLATDPRLDPLRSHPDFRSLLTSAGWD